MESRLRRVRVTSTRVVYENRWMRVHEDRLEREDGSPGLYGWIEKGPAAIVVPIEDGHAWLVEQYRHPVGRRFWEFPQGAWEDGSTSRTGSRTSRAKAGVRRDSNPGHRRSKRRRQGSWSRGSRSPRSPR